MYALSLRFGKKQCRHKAMLILQVLSVSLSSSNTQLIYCTSAFHQRDALER